VGDGAFSSLSAGSSSGNSGVGCRVNERVDDEQEPNAFRGGGIFAMSMASGGEGEEISIDNMGD
jgi:hypothetical protein